MKKEYRSKIGIKKLKRCGAKEETIMEKIREFHTQRIKDMPVAVKVEEKVNWFIRLWRKVKNLWQKLKLKRY